MRNLLLTIFFALIPIIVCSWVTLGGLYDLNFGTVHNLDIPDSLCQGDWNARYTKIVALMYLAFLFLFQHLEDFRSRNVLQFATNIASIIVIFITGTVLLIQGGLPVLAVYVVTLPLVWVFWRFPYWWVHTLLIIYYCMTSAFVAVWINICALEHTIMWGYLSKDWWFFFTDWHFLSSHLQYVGPTLLIGAGIGLGLSLIHDMVLAIDHIGKKK